MRDNPQAKRDKKETILTTFPSETVGVHHHPQPQKEKIEINETEDTKNYKKTKLEVPETLTLSALGGAGPSIAWGGGQFDPLLLTARRGLIGP